MDPPPKLRIACLIPSATDICVALNLNASIVGVTHECNTSRLSSSVRVLTADGVNASTSTQAEIHAQVTAMSTCAREQNASDIPSLYPILPDQLEQAAPTHIITQDLCHVCAPSSITVRRLVGTMETSQEIQIVTLTPSVLSDIAENMVTVATACGIPDRGQQVKADFLANLQALQMAVKEHRDPNRPVPRVMLLEWLDPPFDGGHWIPEMIETQAQAKLATPKSTHKSTETSWRKVEEADPDVVLVACCGFNLQRNVKDAMSKKEHWQGLRAAKESRVFATDGDSYFAKPGPGLLLGSAIIAMLAYGDQPAVVRAVRELSFVPTDFVAWQKLDVDAASTSESKSDATPDMEDFFVLHQEACARGEMNYTDPKTGYSVFTELAHKQRGKCCGSGCRHCPYSHENLRDKSRIQQPGFLHHGTHPLLQTSNGHIRVLFFSGGKDSYLTIREVARQAKATPSSPFGLVLLTTYDATSRIIAHQDIHIDTVVKQAQHLNISLVGVPMHRGSSEGYVSRIQRALQAIERETEQRVEALVFGDLHLEHILAWREDQLGPLGYRLDYPLLKRDYKLLMEDLEASKIVVEVSSSTVPQVQLGQLYNRALTETLREQGLDAFGECGEFHTVAQVWKATPKEALGV